MPGRTPRLLVLSGPASPWRPGVLPLAPASGITSPVSSKQCAGSRRDGEGPWGVYMYQCSGREQTARSREVIQKTSIKETLSMGAFRLRSPNSFRVPPLPPCHLSDPFRGESRGVRVSSLSASRAPFRALAPVSAGLTCFFQLVNLEREKDLSAPVSLQPLLQEVSSAKITGPHSRGEGETLIRSCPRRLLGKDAGPESVPLEHTDKVPMGKRTSVT